MVDSDLVFFADISCFEYIFLVCKLRSVLNGYCSDFFIFSEEVNSEVPCDGIKPRFELTFAVIAGLFSTEQYECILRKILGGVDISHYTAQIKDKTVLIVSDYLGETVHVAFVAETAVAACTVVHWSSPFRRGICSSYITRKKAQKPHTYHDIFLWAKNQYSHLDY